VERFYGADKVRYDALSTSNMPIPFICRLLMTGDPDVKVPIVMDMLYPQPWLAEKAEDDPEGRTNLEVQSAVSIVIPLWNIND
jgi:hypothetical protein